MKTANPAATMSIDLSAEAVQRDAEPFLVSDERLLYLPPTAEAWDVERGGQSRGIVSIRPGLFRYDMEEPQRARMLRSAEWKRLERRRESPGDIDAAALQTPQRDVPMPIVATLTPDGQYVAGEVLALQMLPAGSGYHELTIRRVGDNRRAGKECDSDRDAASGDGAMRVIVQGSQRRFKHGLEPGKYTIRTRWLPTVDRWDGDCALWSPWSKPLEVTVHRKRDEEAAMKLRFAEHRLALMSDRDANGVVTLTDPWALPPNCPYDEPVRWFRTPCYEGSSMLINELPAYYRDPFRYYLECIKSLVDRGFVFRTWNELIGSPGAGSEREVVLQFDLDAGPKSFARLFPKLREMGVTASLMVHRRCFDWYEYEIEQCDIDLLKGAERAGWAIGYHNNSIGNAQRLERAGDYSDDVLNEAQRRFAQDVADLRRWFNIKVFTHHGGNVINRRTAAPPEANVICVDKAFNPGLWKTIDRNFSDGSFTSRPKPLRERLDEFDRGRFFIRNHPVKYGNYTADFDLPPLVAEDIEKVGGRVTNELRQRIACEIEKQALWINNRLAHRVGQRITRASHHKPLTEAMRPRKEVAPVVERFYEQRGEKFMRQSPWMWATRACSGGECSMRSRRRGGAS